MKQKANLLLQAVFVLGLLISLGHGASGQQSPPQQDTKDQSAAQTSPAANTDPANAGQSSAPSASTADNAQNSKTNSKAAQDQENDSEAAKHKVHVRLGGIIVGAGYAYSSGVFCCYGFYPYGPYSSFYSPLFYPTLYSYPFYDLYGYSPYYYGSDLGYAHDKGEIQLSSSVKGAQVFIDDAYAGTADKLKNFWLAPGAYNVSVSAIGHQTYKERVYVLTGKSLKLKAILEPEKPVHANGEEKL